MRTIERMVDQEVICNVSALVSAIASTYGLINSGRDERQPETEALSEQAFELCCPIQDWESAALEAGWTRVPHSGMFNGPVGGTARLADYDDWQELCDDNDIDPHEREIFEHYFVTPWLAERLEGMGERIDRDFAGHCVWGRTITGQSPSMDSVIMDVYAHAKGEYEDAFPA